MTENQLPEVRGNGERGARLAEKYWRGSAFNAVSLGPGSHLQEFPSCDFGHSHSFVPLLDSACQITHHAVMPTRAFGFLCNLIYYCTQGDLHAVPRPYIS